MNSIRPSAAARLPRASGWLRWLRFVSVGSGGFLLQISMIALLHGVLGWHYLLATFMAVESAILHNFCWHRHWTWGNRRCQEWLGRLFHFHVMVGAVSLGGNLILMALMVGVLGMPVLPSNLAAVACCGIANYLFCDRSVFAAAPQQPPSPHSIRCGEPKPGRPGWLSRRG